MCEPVDVPVNKRHLDMVYAHLRYSDKAFMGSVTHPSRAADSIEMARIVFGADVVENNCVIMGNVNVNSPLVWDATMTGALKTYAAANQAPVVVPFILGGAMGPVTTAGAVAQAHAETLVGVALGQLVRPGSPAIYGNFLSSMDLHSGSPTFGTPEPALGSLVVGQLARRVGLPLRCSGAFTSSKIPDGQAMSESAVSMLAALLCGANFILHSAGWLEGGLAMGYEKFMMDLDLCGAAHTYLKGFDLSPDQFAIDGFAEIGPGKHFFSAQHTLRHYETAFYEPALSDSSSFEQWRDAGERSSEDRAAVAVPARCWPTTRLHPSTTRSTPRCSTSSPGARLRCPTSGTERLLKEDVVMSLAIDMQTRLAAIDQRKLRADRLGAGARRAGRTTTTARRC